MNSDVNPAFTACELAKACGVSERRIQQLAARNWPYVKEPLRGGRRRRYPLEGLPLEIAAKVLRWRASAAVEKPGSDRTPVFEYDAGALWEAAAKSSAEHRREGEIRARILRDVETLMRDEGLSFVAAARRVAARTGRSSAAIRSWHYGRKIRGVRSRGARDYAPQDRAAALIPRSANSGRPRKEFPGDLASVFESLWLNESKPTVADAYRRTRERAEAESLDRNSPALAARRPARREEDPPRSAFLQARGRASEREHGPQAADRQERPQGRRGRLGATASRSTRSARFSPTARFASPRSGFSRMKRAGALLVALSARPSARRSFTAHCKNSAGNSCRGG